MLAMASLQGSMQAVRSCLDHMFLHDGGELLLYKVDRGGRERLIPY
jgi:hypothetical protein